MTCVPLIDANKKVTGFVCYTPNYYTFVGSRKIEFTYAPYYGISVLGKNGNERNATRKEIDAVCDWIRRNTYQRARNGNRERIGYVKKRWKP